METISVGTVCCDNLTGTKEATLFRKRLERKCRFSKSKRWKELPSGLFIKQNQLEIEVQAESGKFRIYMNKVKGKRLFETIEEAKSFVFDSVEDGEAQAYFEKHPVAN